MDNSDQIASHHLDSHFLSEKSPSKAAQEIFEKQMNVDKAVIRKVLEAAMSQGGDFSDLFFEYTLRNSIILEESIIKNSFYPFITNICSCFLIP